MDLERSPQNSQDGCETFGRLLRDFLRFFRYFFKSNLAHLGAAESR
jgi:hypothetical protein